MTNGELLEAGMTTVANRGADRVRSPYLEQCWWDEHQALMDYNSEKSSKADYNELRRCRMLVIKYEKRILRP